MKTSNNTRSRGQVYSVGNYLMTGKVLGKGHFARVEEATHRIIGKKVAIKIIDLTCIKEEYARRNLHREPRVMAKLRHPCIAALYETMMHGPRLYVVMEAAGGGDLCAHVLAARGPARGLPEARARALAAQLVSAVRHMHARGVVHRDLKMENIMLDSTKQFIKIVDFGLSNLWSAGGGLRTPCGSLEYAAPELFMDGRRYGPEVDLWSIGVIVYGMVTGGLPFTGAEGGSGRSRPQLRAAISRGFTRKQRSALACVSNECKMFIQQLLEPNVELRMKIDEAARHRWVKRPGMKMKVHPLGSIDPKVNREIYKQIAELCGQSVIDAVAQIKAEPFGSIAGIYNIKTHLHQIQSVSGVDLLWSSMQEVRPCTPPEYRPGYESRPETAPSSSKASSPPLTLTQPIQRKMIFTPSSRQNAAVSNVTKPSELQNIATNASIRTQNQNGTVNGALSGPSRQLNGAPNGPSNGTLSGQSRPLNGSINGPTRTINCALNGPSRTLNGPTKPLTVQRMPPRSTMSTGSQVTKELPRAFPERSIDSARKLQSPRFSLSRPTSGSYKKQVYNDSGDCGLDPRLPCINEHSNTDFSDKKKRAPFVRRVNLEEERRLSSCPNRMGDGRRTDFYRRGGDALPNWRATGTTTPSTRILLQSNATTIKRASLGNIVSPHSSTNSQCKSERAMPVGWFGSRTVPKEPSPLQRLRRTAPMK